MAAGSPMCRKCSDQERHVHPSRNCWDVHKCRCDGCHQMRLEESRRYRGGGSMEEYLARHRTWGDVNRCDTGPRFDAYTRREIMEARA